MERLRQCNAQPAAIAAIYDDHAAMLLGAVGRNIENYVGTLKVPVGTIGPLVVHGAGGTWSGFVPLATTEATLVASYGRGAKLISAAGGCDARVTESAISRAPLFSFESIPDAMQFAYWLRVSADALTAVTSMTTRYGHLTAIEPCIEGNRVYVRFEFTTGDAAGQNMVTIATHAMCAFVLANSPVPIVSHYIEANYSGDKKATALSMPGVRGRRVSAEITLSRELVERNLHTTPERMSDYWRAGAVGGAMAGQIGIQGHYANGLAALYLATGQDVACVAESATGITRFEVSGDGDLYASVTLPNVVVGTIGGGTRLPSQSACRALMQLPQSRSSDALAEIAASVCLAGELSISGAICADHFARAHQEHARV